MIPYASRTVDIILHPDCPLPKKGAKDVINLLKLRELSSDVEAVVQLSPERYRLTFHHARQMNAFANQDFYIHGKPVEFRSVSPFTWVYISRLSYGIPDEAITRALAPYSGGIKTIKSVAHENIYTGEHNVLMKITANIPARLRIAGHWCVVKYSGQKPVCFKCHKEGHVIADCPTFQYPHHINATHSSNNNNNSASNDSAHNTNTEPSAPIAPSRPLVSYAAVAGGNLLQNAPSESADGSSTPLSNCNIRSAPDCASGALDPPTPSAPSGEGDTAEMDHSSAQPSSPVRRRRGKRRHPPTHSPQPEEKRIASDDVVGDDITAAIDPVDEECTWSHISTDHSRTELACTTLEDENTRPETVPLPQDSDDDDNDDDNDETDMDDENNRNTEEDGETETGHGQTIIHDNHDDDDDDDDEDDEVQDSEEDQMDPDEYLDLQEDKYPSDDNASFATVSEADLPTSPAPNPVTISLRKKDATSSKVSHDESAGAIAHEADALYKLAAVLPTQGGSSSS